MCPTLRDGPVLEISDPDKFLKIVVGFFVTNLRLWIDEYNSVYCAKL